MAHVLLINPWAYDFTAFDLWSKPLGLLYLGAHLKRRGFKVTLLDCLDRGDPDSCAPKNEGPRKLREAGCGGYFREILPKPVFFSSIPRRFKRFGMPREKVLARLWNLDPPDVVLVTCGFTYWYPGASVFAEILRRAFPRAFLVLGGVYPTLCPDHAERLGFDAVVSVADPLSVSRHLEGLLGTSLGIRTYEDFFAVPPAFELYPRLSYGVVLSSLGCPFSCTYCASRILAPSFFQRPPQDVAEEIRYLFERFGVRHIAFYDDALLFRTESHFLPLAEYLVRLNLPVSFHLPNGLHARYVTREVARFLKRANFSTVRLSLETAVSPRQKQSGGKVTNELFEEAVRALQEAGFSPQDIEVYLLFGWPVEEEGDVVASVLYVRSLGLVPRLALYAPTPGTKDYETFFSHEEEPLWHNKIAFLYRRGWSKLYERLQGKGKC
ncbi:B12-binding domain-containing radical SAM protein [Candidatus Caldatribacterium saccharofermentans]|uniref:B12-binding domain-containing radical SAM protein n=1 Tax=Candidatus Caldatribacterium saccharofermentans TaxID=1454753 RepID=A0A7V4TFH9_9BACT